MIERGLRCLRLAKLGCKNSPILFSSTRTAVAASDGTRLKEKQKPPYARSFAANWTGPVKGCWRHITVPAVFHGM